MPRTGVAQYPRKRSTRAIPCKAFMLKERVLKLESQLKGYLRRRVAPRVRRWPFAYRVAVRSWTLASHMRWRVSRVKNQLRIASIEKLRWLLNPPPRRGTPQSGEPKQVVMLALSDLRIDPRVEREARAL